MFTIKNLLLLIVRNTIISFIFVALSLAGIFFINKKIEIITNNIVLNHKLISELKKRTELFSTIETDSEIVGKNDILINNAFVPSNNISKFTNTLDDLASENQITQIYRFETPVLSGTSGEFSTSTISYTNNISADISVFSKYLKDFEKLPYFTKIEGFNIASQDKNGIVGLSNISIKATLLTQTIQ